jgi:hypothetical protein
MSPTAAGCDDGRMESIAVVRALVVDRLGDRP